MPWLKWFNYTGLCEQITLILAFDAAAIYTDAY